VASSTIVPVVNKAVYQNLQVLAIDSVLKIPQSLSDTLVNSTYDVTSVAGALSSINVSPGNSTTLLDVLNNSRGITLFAPNNTAIATANCISGLLPNTTALIALFGNHVCPPVLHFTWFDINPGYQWHDCLLASIHGRE
jgi:hypothetical protein